jgi:hypothetical protein
MTRRPVPLVLAVGALATSIGFIASVSIRKSSPIYLHLGRVAFLWHGLLLVGGLATIIGVRSMRLKMEAFGLTLVCGGSLFYVAGAFVARGWAAWTAGILITSASIAMLVRVYALTRGRPWS